MRRRMLITGGSRGIGAATALKAAEAGYDVALSYLAEEAAARQIANRVSELGGRAIVLSGEVTDEPTVEGWFERVHREWGGLDCMVNNIGIVAPASRLEDFSVERVRRVLDVNVVGAILCAKFAVRCMSRRHGGEGGNIVNVSSAASYIGSANEYIDYAASKGAVDTLTLGLSKEVAAEGIRVNAVRPGLIRTELHARNGAPDRLERLASGIPLQRAGTPEEVAEAILWLASEKASYVTGSLLNCSGGR